VTSTCVCRVKRDLEGNLLQLAPCRPKHNASYIPSQSYMEALPPHLQQFVFLFYLCTNVSNNSFEYFEICKWKINIQSKVYLSCNIFLLIFHLIQIDALFSLVAPHMYKAIASKYIVRSNARVLSWSSMNSLFVSVHLGIV
jgi:hypothetical protein